MFHKVHGRRGVCIGEIRLAAVEYVLAERAKQSSLEGDENELKRAEQKTSLLASIYTPLFPFSEIWLDPYLARPS